MAREFSEMVQSFYALPKPETDCMRIVVIVNNLFFAHVELLKTNLDRSFTDMMETVRDTPGDPVQSIKTIIQYGVATLMETQDTETDLLTLAMAIHAFLCLTSKISDADKRNTDYLVLLMPENLDFPQTRLLGADTLAEIRDGIEAFRRQQEFGTLH